MDTSLIAIQLNDVVKRYGEHTVLEHIDANIEAGTMLALIGPNGSGKSTLARIIVGLEEQTSGEVNIFGQKPKSMSHRIGYVPQTFEFDRTIPLTVEEFLGLAACQSRQHKQCASVHAALEQVDMEPHAHRKIGILSGGQLQRVLIARALLHEQDILVLDEPSTGVDAKTQEVLYKTLSRLQKEKGVTIIVVSHELDFVTTHATQVLCINKEQVCHGIPEKVMTHEVMKKLYGPHVGLYKHTHE